MTVTSSNLDDAQVKHVIEAADNGENPIWQPLHIGGVEPLDGDTPAEYGRKVLQQWIEDQSTLADQEPPTLADEYGNALLRVVVRPAGDQDTTLATVEATDQPRTITLVSATQGDRCPGIEISDPDSPVDWRDLPADAQAWADAQGYGDDAELLYVLTGDDRAPEGYPTLTVTL